MGHVNHATGSSATAKSPDLIRSVGYRLSVIWSSEILHGATSAKSHYGLVFLSASPAGAPRQKGNANKNEINWTAKREGKKKIHASINPEREGSFLYFYIFSLWVLGQTCTAIIHMLLISLSSAAASLIRPAALLERSRPHDLEDAAGTSRCLQTECDRSV